MKLMNLIRKYGVWLVLGLLCLFTSNAGASTDATDIVTDSLTAFAAVGSACVTIGTFFVVYRLAKRVR